MNVSILLFWVAGSSVITNAALVDTMSRISGLWASSEGFHGTCCIQVCYVAFRAAYTPSQSSVKMPANLLMPQFTYTDPAAMEQATPIDDTVSSADTSKPYAFSALFQSSVSSKAKGTPRLPSILQATPQLGRRSFSAGSSSAHKAIASFIGFSWGPSRAAFDTNQAGGVQPTPARRSPVFSARGLSPIDAVTNNGLVTPMRTPAAPPTAMSTIRVTKIANSVQRSAQQRIVSDREAMKQLVDCVGMSARKRVLESGKKPRILQHFASAGGLSFGSSRSRSASLSSKSMKLPAFNAATVGQTNSLKKELRFDGTVQRAPPSRLSMRPVQEIFDFGESDTSTEGESTDGDIPPSPSPSPRPGSAMSMGSLSRRSVTPTITGSFPLLRANSEPPTATTTSGFVTDITANTLLIPHSFGTGRNNVRVESKAAALIPHVLKGEIRRETPPGSDGERDDTLIDQLERRHARLNKDLLDLRNRIREFRI